MENANSNEYLEKIKNAVVENLKKTAAPSVQMQDVPRQSLGMTDEDEALLDDLDEDENKDVRMTQRRWDKHVSRDDEYEESDDEEMAEANGVYQTNGKGKSILDHKNPDAPDDFSRPPTPDARRIDSPEPEVEEEVEEEVDTNEGDETMEDIDAGIPEEPAAEKTAEAHPAPQEAGADTEVDEEGDVDMTEAVEPAEAPAIKEEEADAQPAATAAAEPTTANDNPSDKAEGGSPKSDQPVEPTSDAHESPKASEPPAAKSEEPKTTEKPATPKKPEETTDASASEAAETTQIPDEGDKPVEGEQPVAPAEKSTED